MRWGRNVPETSGGPGPTRRIPEGFAEVDPRTAVRVPLWQELSPDNPLYPGDPPFTVGVHSSVGTSGFRVERITSLGTHTGTHVSVPAHVIDGGAALNGVGEGWTLMPLVVVDVRERVAASGGDFTVGPAALREIEEAYGPIPDSGCVLLNTGFSVRYRERGQDRHRDRDRDQRQGQGQDRGQRQDRGKDRDKDRGQDQDRGDGPDRGYRAPAPGFTADAVAWLFTERRIAAVGSDTFGPDPSSDPRCTATLTALELGGITVENVGPGLSRMRCYGDWVGVNGARPAFSGFPVGITGYTLP
jgi:kynurenine formamidase